MRLCASKGLDPKTQAPFLGILIKGYGKKRDDKRMRRFCEVVLDIVDHIRQEIAAVDFWRSRPAREILKEWIITEIDDLDVIPFLKSRRNWRIAARVMSDYGEQIRWLNDNGTDCDLWN